MHTDRPALAAYAAAPRPARRSLVARSLRLVVRGLVGLPLAVVTAPMALLRRLGPSKHPSDDGPRFREPLASSAAAS